MVPKSTASVQLATRGPELREHVDTCLLRGAQMTGSRFEQIFTYYHRARQHFPQRYQNMLRLRLPAILKVSLRYACTRCESMRRGGELFRMEFAQASESVRIVGVQNQNYPVFLFGFGFPAACKVNVAERDVRVTVESG